MKKEDKKIYLCSPRYVGELTYKEAMKLDPSLVDGELRLPYPYLFIKSKPNL